jgi:hypothetical protein
VHRFVPRTLLGFSSSQTPECIENGPPPKGHLANLTELWEARPNESAAQRIDAVLRAKSGVQLNIRKVFLMFGILSVFLTIKFEESTLQSFSEPGKCKRMRSRIDSLAFPQGSNDSIMPGFSLYLWNYCP